MTAPATETCSECAGIGFTAANPLRECPTCYGLGRIPVPLRSCLTDAADDETERLKRRLEIATRALERISTSPNCDCDCDTCGCGNRAEEWAADALEQLSK